MAPGVQNELFLPIVGDDSLEDLGTFLVRQADLDRVRTILEYDHLFLVKLWSLDVLSDLRAWLILDLMEAR